MPSGKPETLGKCPLHKSASDYKQNVSPPGDSFSPRFGMDHTIFNIMKSSSGHSAKEALKKEIAALADKKTIIEEMISDYQLNYDHCQREIQQQKNLKNSDNKSDWNKNPDRALYLVERSNLERILKGNIPHPKEVQSRMKQFQKRYEDADKTLESQKKFDFNYAEYEGMLQEIKEFIEQKLNQHKAELEKL